MNIPAFSSVSPLQHLYPSVESNLLGPVQWIFQRFPPPNCGICIKSNFPTFFSLSAFRWNRKKWADFRGILAENIVISPLDLLVVWVIYIFILWALYGVTTPKPTSIFWSRKCCGHWSAHLASCSPLQVSQSSCNGGGNQMPCTQAHPVEKWDKYI